MTKIKMIHRQRIKTIAVYESVRWLILNPPSNIASFSSNGTNHIEERIKTHRNAQREIISD